MVQWPIIFCYSEFLNSHFNAHFHFYLTNNFRRPFAKISWQYASTYEIEKIFKSLRTKNTCGYDEISNCIIKLTAPFIFPPLTHICNAVLSTAVFPDRLKYAVVKPIFKKGNKQEISNYRPISLLTSFSKITELSFMLDSMLTLI